ncbi:hypothetical protein [Rubritalea sp.]
MKNVAVQKKDAQNAASEAQKLDWLVAFFFPHMSIVAVFGEDKPSDNTHA